MVQLETAVQELAQKYYQTQIKLVRGHREQLNRTSHLQLLVRHGFKLGFLDELKSDHHAAYKSYTAVHCCQTAVVGQRCIFRKPSNSNLMVQGY